MGKNPFLHQKNVAIFGLEKKTGFLDWNYTFFHVSGHVSQESPQKIAKLLDMPDAVIDTSKEVLNLNDSFLELLDTLEDELGRNTFVSGTEGQIIAATDVPPAGQIITAAPAGQIITATEVPAGQIIAATEQEPQRTSEIKTNAPKGEDINNAFMDLMECFPDFNGLEPPILPDLSIDLL